MKKYTILFYNKMWNDDFDLSGIAIPEEFTFTTNKEHFKKADAVVFHIPSLSLGHDISKKKGQLWVFWSMECNAHYKWLMQIDKDELFDLRMTYHFDSDIPMTYIEEDFIERLRTHPLPKTGVINSFISSPFNESKRLECVSELMALMDVHSYGRMFKNRNLVDDSGYETKIRTIAKYKFTLACENAIDRDYVTEKFFDPLIAGSIPVYLGAPNIDEFAPGDNCFINISSFSSTKELAAYLLELDENDHLYDQYLEWKSRPFRKEFLEKINAKKEHPFTKLCKMVKCKKEKRY